MTSDNDETQTVYRTRQDAIDRVIRPALEPHQDEYDMDAIFDETFTAFGFVQTVSGPELFWEIVPRHVKEPALDTMDHPHHVTADLPTAPTGSELYAALQQALTEALAGEHYRVAAALCEQLQVVTDEINNAERRRRAGL